ncbi:MAG: HAMP domain-containing histidine kinase [Muribaculaceae bacterium]|nr:HAMP domain-containing histidine kinase [Muribaculaceae bacterium]
MKLNLDIRRHGRALFLISTAAVVAMFLYITDGLVKDLAAQERARMQIWADATKEIIKVSSGEGDSWDMPDISFPLSILESNTNIPVLLTDDEGNILQHRNFQLPEPVDSANITVLSPENEKFLTRRLQALKHTSNVIHIPIDEHSSQHLYYEDSTLLKRLNYFPYIQLVVMLAFIAVVYFAVLSTKKAEQNKVWVGLSKETAHQLGTPISSLMAWLEILPDMGVDSTTVEEMNKDVTRLSTIASRFSKIGSDPTLESTPLNSIIESAVQYMSVRISGRISLSFIPDTPPDTVINCSPPLFQWVLENLIKNAVDAMDGSGSITVTTGIQQGKGIYIDVTDTGKGIPRKNQKRIFNPGFTTKKRGWGLGLTLARRIVQQYHHGRIYVRHSAPGEGTVFRIELPV